MDQDSTETIYNFYVKLFPDLSKTKFMLKPRESLWFFMEKYIAEINGDKLFLYPTQKKITSFSIEKSNFDDLEFPKADSTLSFTFKTDYGTKKTLKTGPMESNKCRYLIELIAEYFLPNLK